MTIEQLFDPTEGGNGSIEYRIQIEGFDYSFVTSMDMSNLNMMPKRINGLLRKGIKISQEIAFPQSMLTINTNNFTIVDYQEKATEAFYRKPTFVCYLMQDITPTDTTIQVSTTEGLNVGDYLWIGSECMKVLGILYDSLNQVIVQRGAIRSTPQAFYTLSEGGKPVRPILRNVPPTIERRRAYLYAYGAGDDLQGDGTLIWRGLVMTQPSFQGTYYSFEVGPITELLKSELGVDSDDMKLRGINLGDSPFRQWQIKVELSKRFETGFGGLFVPIPYDSFVLNINDSTSSFFDDKYQLVSRIDSLIKSNITASISSGKDFWLSGSFGCSLTKDGQIALTQKSIEKGDSTYAFVDYSTIGYPCLWNQNKNYLQSADPDILNIFKVKQSYFYPLNSDGNIDDAHQYTVQTIPTESIQCSVFENRDFPDQFTNYVYGLNQNRLYLSTPINNFVNDIVIYDADGKEIATNNLDANNAPEPINYYQTNTYIAPHLKVYKDLPIVNNNYKITLASTFGQSLATGARDVNNVRNDVIGFLRLLIERSPYNTSNGLSPLITEEDIDIDDMQRVFDELSLKQIQNNRKYIFIKRSKKLIDILNEEFKLIGVYPALTNEGKLTIRSFRNINQFEQPDYTFDSDSILTDNGYPKIETNKYGIWNSSVFRSGYNAITEKFEGVSVVRNIVDSISTYGRSKQIEIAPISRNQYSATLLSPDLDIDITDVSNRLLLELSKDYWVVTFDIPIKYFYVNLGSVVRIKNKQLPNYTPNFSFLTSRRGNANILGTVVGKNFDLEKGFGTLAVLVSDTEFLGTDIAQRAIYCPDALLNASKTNLGGNRWIVNLETANVFLPDGITQEDVWSVGDSFRVEKINTTTQSTGYGVIESISGSGNALSFVLDFNPGIAPASFATGEYLIKIGDYNYIYTTDTQKKYAFISKGTTETNNVNYCREAIRVFGY